MLCKIWQMPWQMWLEKSQLHWNISKTVSMYYSKRAHADNYPHVSVQGKSIELVQRFKYLQYESLLIHNFFLYNTQKILNRIKFTVSNFTSIRNNLTRESAKQYFDTMIMSHMSYCLTTWASACKTTLSQLK